MPRSSLIAIVIWSRTSADECLGSSGVGPVPTNVQGPDLLSKAFELAAPLLTDAAALVCALYTARRYDWLFSDLLYLEPAVCCSSCLLCGSLIPPRENATIL